MERGLKIPDGLRSLAETLDHPEGLCWCPRAKTIYAGGEHGQIYRVAPKGGTVELIAQIPNAFILGLAVDGAGLIYACDIGNHRVQRIDPRGTVEPYGDEIFYPNYPVFAADGKLYVSDSGSWGGDDGAVICIEPGGHTTRLPTPPLQFPNGLALLGDWLYVAESTRPGVMRMPRQGGEIRNVVDLDQVIPDGLAFDAEDGLWIACWQPNRIMRLASDGSLTIVADDWSGFHLLTPTNVAFAGDELAELAFSTLGGNFIRAFPPGVKGRALNYPQVTP